MSITLGWLHFTDLHRGMASQKGWWSDREHKLFQDLRARHRATEPWDLVLFTGDLTDRGTDGTRTLWTQCAPRQSGKVLGRGSLNQVDDRRAPR